MSDLTVREELIVFMDDVRDYFHSDRWKQPLTKGELTYVEELLALIERIGEQKAASVLRELLKHKYGVDLDCDDGCIEDVVDASVIESKLKELESK